MPVEKIFQIGFNKCATRSISHFFKLHGLQVADWMHGSLARDLAADVKAGHTPLHTWKANVFTDMESVNAREIIEGYKYFRTLHEAYPNALFILNTRNVEGWVRSRHGHGDGAYTSAYRRYHGFASDEEVFDFWRMDWFSHHLAILDYFHREDKEALFVWDIDKPDFEGLEKRAGFQIIPDKWPHRGKTG